MLKSILVFILLFSMITLELGCSKKEKDQKSHETSESKKEEHHEEENSSEIHLSKENLSALNLQMEEVKKQSIFQEIETTGKVVQDTNKATFVFSRSSGIVGKIHAQVGQTVNKGQPLLQVGQGTLRAPKKGTVISINTSSGSRVGILDALVTLADIDTIRAVLDIYPKDMDKIIMGQKVEVSLIGHEKEVFPGTVQYLSPNLDETSQTLKVGVDVQNTDHHLKFGMFVQGRILTQKEKEILVVPEEAVVRFDKDFVVFVPGDEEGTFLKRPVKVGQHGRGVVEILEGLKEGEKVVTRGSFTLKSESLKGSMKEGD